MYILKQNLLCSLILSFFPSSKTRYYDRQIQIPHGGFFWKYTSKRILIVCFRVISISELVSRCCCSFPEEVRTGRNRLCWQNPFKKATKWLKIKKRKYTTLGNHYPFCIKSDSRVVFAIIWKMGLREVEQGILHWTYFIQISLLCGPYTTTTTNYYIINKNHDKVIRPRFAVATAVTNLHAYGMA